MMDVGDSERSPDSVSGFHGYDIDECQATLNPVKVAVEGDHDLAQVRVQRTRHDAYTSGPADSGDRAARA